MKTEIMTETFLETALKKYTITEADIAKMSDECLGLKVASVIDKEGYKIVKQARTSVRKARIVVETIRTGLKKESLEFGRGVDARAKELTALITPIEEHLLEQEQIVTDEELRIANENARLAQEVIDKAEAIKKEEEETERAKIKADQEAEDARLEIVRKGQEVKEKELKEAQDKIDAENRKIEADKAEREYEKQRQEDAEKAQERAKIEVEEKAKAEAEKERLKKEQDDKDEALRVALMPDYDKLKALADAIEAIEMPALSHDNSHIVLGDAKIYLEKACKTLRQ